MMKRRKRKPEADSGRTPDRPVAPERYRMRAAGLIAIGIATAVIVGLKLRSPAGKADAAAAYVSRQKGHLTFNKNIAPIVFHNCAPCHRPGQAAPFNLLNYEDARKRAKQIMEVTQRRYMPPWLPEHGYGDFADERRLSVGEIGMIRQWVAEGAMEGQAADLPPLPKWTEGWELSQPDLIVTPPTAYALAPDGLSWVLEPNSDLLLQVHMHPTGKPETVQPSVGFYFSDKPATNTPYRINLLRYAIDIPPGAGEYAVENRYLLPVDVDLLRISPHTHYLGKELQSYAILPGGSRKWLILIKNWDFNWQGDYRYAEPVFLPKGTTLVMHFTYDNSADNVHNPNQPPKRVRFGLQTTDEMAELGLQLLPRNPGERETLARDFFVKFTKDAVEENEALLRVNPNDAARQMKLGTALFMLGRVSETLDHLRAAVQLRPDDDQAHYQLGSLYLHQNQFEAARAEFETVLRLKPDDFQASGSLGYIFLRQRNLDRARLYLENALRINPDDPIARANFERVRKAKEVSGKQN